MERHFTATGFVSHDGRTALHWHHFGMWLPPGGHLEANEDPAQAALREVREETGIAVEIVATAAPFAYPLPPQVATPATIGIYDVAGDGALSEPHQHIDFVYFTRPTTGSAVHLPPGDEAWRWVEEEALHDPDHAPLSPRGEPVTIAEDVRRLGVAAISAVRGSRGA